MFRTLSPNARMYLPPPSPSSWPPAPIEPSHPGYEYVSGPFRSAPAALRARLLHAAVTTEPTDSPTTTPTNSSTARPLPPVSPNNSTARLGAKLIKTLYVEYTDATFRHRKPRPADEEYLGLLGPVLRAEVGDTMKVRSMRHAVVCGVRQTVSRPADVKCLGLLGPVMRAEVGDTIKVRMRNAVVCAVRQTVSRPADEELHRACRGL